MCETLSHVPHSDSSLSCKLQLFHLVSFHIILAPLCIRQTHPPPPLSCNLPGGCIQPAFSLLAAVNYSKGSAAALSPCRRALHHRNWVTLFRCNAALSQSRSADGTETLLQPQHAGFMSSLKCRTGWLQLPKK